MQNVIHLCEHPQRKHQEDQYAAFRGQPESGFEIFGDQPHADPAPTETGGTWKARELRLRPEKPSFTKNSVIYFGLEHGLIIGLICGIVVGHIDRATTADLLAEARRAAAQCNIVRAEPEYEEVGEESGTGLD